MLFEDFDYEIFGLKREDINSPSETLMYGIAFKNEYIPYKDYKVYKLVANNDKDRLLLRIYELDQIINDLNLYLDLNSKDNHYYSMFKKYNNELVSLKKTFANNYGPLDLCETNYDVYKWDKNPWPWESDGDMYV